MTRRTRRELERALDDLAGDTVAPDDRDRCDDCGRIVDADEAAGVTADWVVFGCTCNRTLPEGARLLTPGAHR